MGPARCACLGQSNTADQLSRQRPWRVIPKTMTKKHKPTVSEIVELKLLLETHYAAWRAQMAEDDKFYTQNYQVFPDGGSPPDLFEQVRPPSATQIIDM